MQHIVILGNGIAGITAARHIRKRSEDRITIISGETDYFFSRTAIMYIYMGHMKYENTKPYEDWFWEKNRLELKRAWVKSIDFDAKKLIMDGEDFSYDKLILATGSKPNRFGWPGQDLRGVQGLYSYQDLELLEKNTKDVSQAVVVGGGLIGIELTEMLHSRGIPVNYLVREENFWNMVLTKNEAKRIDQHIKEHNIDLRLSTEIEEILDDGTGSVKGVKTKEGKTIECQFVGLTVGVSPNIDFLKGSGLETDKGILVNKYLETNIADVYAIGDCAQIRQPRHERKSIEAVWYTARMMGETIALTLTGNRTAYEPGVWFNSAKFFDIEYQTYGRVWPEPKKDEKHFFWSAENNKEFMTIAYHERDKSVLGVNAFGLRMRHEVWDKWIREKAPLDFCLQNIDKALFNPEFFKAFDIPIIHEYNRQNPEAPLKERKRGILEKIFN